MRSTWSVTAALAVIVLLAGCGGSRAPTIPSSGRLAGETATSPGQITLNALGAQRIGLQVARASVSRASASGSTVSIPYSAVIYDPSGRTYAFERIAALTYREVPITVATIAGNSAYLTRGPAPGTLVVSVGAEELYGVQTGVLAQT